MHCRTPHNNSCQDTEHVNLSKVLHNSSVRDPIFCMRDSVFCTAGRLARTLKELNEFSQSSTS